MRDSQQQAMPATDEMTAMVVWPSIAAFSLGRQVGQACSISAGIGKFFTLGKLMALVTIPLSLALYFWRLAPGAARRYVLTDRRVVVLKGLGAAKEDASIGLDQFDAIEVQVLPGQAFLRAGDLSFRSGGTEILRLPGVQHPEGFRQACLRGQNALISVRQVLAEQARRAESVAAGSKATP